LSAIMQPELMKIQKKYQGKRDQDSMLKMQEETQAVYQKYGVSPTGSCVQLAVQMPILMALWQVIYNIPAYVNSVKVIFTGLVDKIVAVGGYTDLIQNFITDNKMTRVRLLMDGGKATTNSVIDFLYALSPNQWKELASMDQFSGFSDVINNTAAEISKMQGLFRTEHCRAAIELY
ncbi:Membrane insertion protein, OxaA/YidC, partial [gut metagenome]